MYFEDIATIETQNRRPTNINRKFHRKGTNFGSKFSPYPGQLDLSLNNLNHSRRAEELRSYSWLYHLHSIRLVRIKFELTNQDSVSGKIVISCIAVGQLSSLEMALNVDEGIYNTKNFIKLKKKYI